MTYNWRLREKLVGEQLAKIKAKVDSDTFEEIESVIANYEELKEFHTIQKLEVPLHRKGYLKGVYWCKENFYSELKDDSKIMICDSIKELENMIEVKPE